MARQQHHPFRCNLPRVSEVRLDPQGLAAGGRRGLSLLVALGPASAGGIRSSWVLQPVDKAVRGEGRAL